MKKLLTFVLFVADIGLLIFIVTSEPYGSGAQSMAYSGGLQQASVSQGMNGGEDKEQQSAEESQVIPQTDGADYEGEPSVFPESESQAYEGENPVFPETESQPYEDESLANAETAAEGGFDSVLLGEDYSSGEEASDGDYNQGMEESAGQDFSQGSEYADEDSGYYGEEETAELSM